MAWEARSGFLRKSRGVGWRGKKAHEGIPSVFSLEQASKPLTGAVSLGSHLLSLLQGDVIAQGLQAPHRRVALAGRIERLKEVGSQVVVVLVGAQQMIDNHQQAMGDRHDGPLLPDATNQSMVLS